MKRVVQAVLVGMVVAGLSTPARAASECENAVKTTGLECLSACTDGTCRKACGRTQKAELATCRPGRSAGPASPFKGTGTAASPYQVGPSMRETSLQLDDQRTELHFAFRAAKGGAVRLYLSDYTGPIDVTLEGAGKSETTHFIKAPDYPSYARFDVEEGQQYAYSLQLVGSPTSFKLRTLVDESCRIENQFVSLPFGGTCRDQ